MQRNSSGPTIATALACALAACDERIAAPADQAATSPENLAALATAPAARSMIVFDSDRSGNGDLWAMAPDGSGLRRLTEHPGFDVLADVSRDGRSIASQSDREAPFAFRVYVMDADGSNVRRLTAAEAFEASPDGRWLAFHRRITPANAEVHIVRADGMAQAVRLTEESGFDGFVDWTRRLAR